MMKLSFPCKFAKQRLCNRVQLFYDMLLDVGKFDTSPELKCDFFDCSEKIEENSAVEVDERGNTSEKPKAQLSCKSISANPKPLVRIATTPSEKIKIVSETRKRPVRKCRENAFPSSLFEEFENLPIKEKRHAEPTYCVECDEFTLDSNCGDHKPQIVVIRDKEVATGTADRAKLTCPTEVSVCRSGIKDAGLGVYSNCLIKRGTMFGPYEGVFRTDVDVSPESRDGDYSWDVGDGLYVDARNEKKSNWMRYVNNGDAHSRTNLRAVRIKKEVFYVSWKDIKPGFELLIWYGDDYDGEVINVGGSQVNRKRMKDGLSYEKRVKCSYCEAAFKMKQHLILHERTHTGEKPFACSYCEAKFAHKNALIRHERIHTGEKPFACSYCDSKFAQRGELIGHERTHTGEKPFACSYCESKFAQRGTLKKHERIHTGEKPFACSYCESKFAQRDYLEKHKRTHTGEKPFGCRYCERKFAEKSHLIVHERTHTGEKPFACSYCESKFTQRGDVKKHERIHTGEKPFACSYCESKFAERGALKKHERTHTGEKPFGCNYCESKFAQRGALKKHERTHTGEEPLDADIVSRSSLKEVL